MDNTHSKGRPADRASGTGCSNRRSDGTAAMVPDNSHSTSNNGGGDWGWAAQSKARNSPNTDDAAEPPMGRSACRIRKDKFGLGSSTSEPTAWTAPTRSPATSLSWPNALGHSLSAPLRCDARWISHAFVCRRLSSLTRGIKASGRTSCSGRWDEWHEALRQVPSHYLAGGYWQFCGDGSKPEDVDRQRALHFCGGRR